MVMTVTICVLLPLKGTSSLTSYLPKLVTVKIPNDERWSARTPIDDHRGLAASKCHELKNSRQFFSPLSENS